MLRQLSGQPPGAREPRAREGGDDVAAELADARVELLVAGGELDVVGVARRAGPDGEVLDQHAAVTDVVGLQADEGEQGRAGVGVVGPRAAILFSEALRGRCE